MLSFIIIISLFGSLLVLAMRRDLFAKYVACSCATLNFVISVALLVKFDYQKSGFQFTEVWLGCKIFGVDGISLLLLLLSTFLFVLCIISISCSTYPKIRSYLALFLLLESLVVGTFSSLDAIAFYIFFESVLIPMFFIIGIWGSNNRIYAAFKLFLYTLLGSLFFLVALVYMRVHLGSSDIELLSRLAPTLNLEVQKWLWLGCFISFAIKLPMFPLHTWLPDAHVQAPTAGSVILAGVLIKMGGYGFIRFSLAMLPNASVYFSHYVLVLSAIAVVYTSLVALAQTDMKKLIAYSSVAHMGFVTAGIFSFNEYGVSGAVFQMVSHGLISSALFLCVGMIYSRAHTLEISDYSGLAGVMPRYSTMFIFFTMASIGLPITSGFIGEFLPMVGMFEHSKILTLFVASSVVFGAIYMLLLSRRIIWGVSSYPAISEDISKLEFATLLLFAGLVLLLGVYPAPTLDLYLKPVVTELLLNNLKIGG